MENNVTIIIAEDDEGNYILTKKWLRRAGIGGEIVWLIDGRSTLDFLNMTGPGPKRRPEKKYVLLLDIRMPGVDGVGVLERIRDSEELKDIPVVIVTTSDAPRNIQRCNSLGCSAYVVKPLDEAFGNTIVQIVRSLQAA